MMNMVQKNNYSEKILDISLKAVKGNKNKKFFLTTDFCNNCIACQRCYVCQKICNSIKHDSFVLCKTALNTMALICKLNIGFLIP